jgi:molybdopterin molybdotransferase
MHSYEEALRIILDRLQPLPPVDLPLDAAYGHVLAEAIHAGWDLPPADNSAMDGFAFSAAGIKAGACLPICGASYAGHPYAGTVATGQAVRIMTGAVVPADCDTVVPIEDVTVGNDQIQLQRPITAGQHVRQRGEEFTAGTPLLAAGTLLHAGEIGLLAAAGIVRLRVHPKPRVSLLSTGDELVHLGQTPGPGQIINTNLHLLGARLREQGCELLSLGIARDSRDDLADRIAAGLQTDLLLSTGGVSIGDRDHVQEVLQEYGFELGFWKVAIKPGKPVLFGTIGRQAVFGLPGNPAAAAATFELFVRPALRRLAGCLAPLPPKLRVELGATVSGDTKRQSFLWGTLQGENGAFRFLPSDRQGSNQNRALAGGDALLPVAAGARLEAGSQVEVIVLRLPIGSCCP